MINLKKFYKNRVGSVAIEFAIIANVFFIGMVGLFAVGYVFVVKNDLERSLAAAERYAMVHQEEDDELADIIRNSLSTYSGDNVGVVFARAKKDGVDYVKATISYTIDFAFVRGTLGPISVTSNRIFPT